MQIPALIFLVGETDITTRIASDLQSLNVRCRLFNNEATAFDEAREDPPQIAICGPGNDGEVSAFVAKLKGEPALHGCWCLALYSDRHESRINPPENVGPDDFLPLSATAFELRYRVMVGLRIYRAEEHAVRLQGEMDILRLEQQRNSEIVEDTTTQLVEIAAQLQGEIAHNAEIEQEHILSAKSDTIAQAAAALRHEINNPLFAITGSAEAARLRLISLAETTQVDFDEVYRCIDRIQRGVIRIGRVVQGISEMLAPATRDYVAGVTMLDLKRSTPTKDE